MEGRLHKLELVNSPECDRCKQASETVSRVLCDCEALAALRFRHLGRRFLKLGDLEGISVGIYCTMFRVRGCYMHEYKCCTEDQVWSKSMGHYCAPSFFIIFCGVSLFREYLYLEDGGINILRNTCNFYQSLIVIFQRTGMFTSIAVSTSELKGLSYSGQGRDRYILFSPMY